MWQTGASGSGWRDSTAGRPCPPGAPPSTADDAAANSTIDTVQFGRVVHGKRERPHLYFDASLNPAAFVTGVCITPECDPFAGTFNASADCSSATQYHHCDANSPGPGWYDRTYTLVQGIRGA